MMGTISGNGESIPRVLYEANHVKEQDLHLLKFNRSKSDLKISKFTRHFRPFEKVEPDISKFLANKITNDNIQRLKPQQRKNLYANLKLLTNFNSNTTSTAYQAVKEAQYKDFNELKSSKSEKISDYPIVEKEQKKTIELPANQGGRELQEVIPVKLPDRQSHDKGDKTNIVNAINSNFSPGQVFRYVGKPQTVDIKELNELGAKRHYIHGDGSCWSRSLWQSVFHQIFSDENEFDRFINTIKNPENGYEIPPDLSKNTIHILHQLKGMSLNQRVDYLNHSNVDDTLVFFMRHVAGEFMRKNYTFYTPEDISDIKTNKRRYGGPEIDAFMRYFQLETHTITKNDRGKWIYRHRDKSLKTQDTDIENMAKHSNKLPHTCIFGVSDTHFEAISFTPSQTQGELAISPNIVQGLDALENQIKKDYELAVKLQAEYNDMYQQELTDYNYAEELQKTLNEGIEKQEQ